MVQDALLRDLRAIVGAHFALNQKEDVIVYEQDGSIFQVMPEIVVVPDYASATAKHENSVSLD